jgi:hypothetical protein
MSQFLFKNEGGVISVDGLTIENVVIDALFAIENNGAGSIQNTRVTGTSAMVRFSPLCGGRTEGEKNSVRCPISSAYLQEAYHHPFVLFVRTDGRLE